MSRSDSRLSKKVWDLVDRTFGGEDGHSVDLMALDSNAMLGKTGVPLPHFSLHSSPKSVRICARWIDRGTEWQPLLGVGNPTAGRVVKNYLADVREEQLKARVVARLVEPVLLVDLEVISGHIHSKLLVSS